MLGSSPPALPATVSAAWPKGPLKEDHWFLNLRARALENTVWVAGAAAVGPDVTGRSAIVDPLAVVRAELDEHSASTATVDVSAQRTQHARRALPVLEQRRAAYGDTEPAAQSSRPSLLPS